jgi:hypothetical protein
MRYSGKDTRPNHSRFAIRRPQAENNKNREINSNPTKTTGDEKSSHNHEFWKEIAINLNSDPSSMTTFTTTYNEKQKSPQSYKTPQNERALFNTKPPKPQTELKKKDHRFTRRTSNRKGSIQGSGCSRTRSSMPG